MSLDTVTMLRHGKVELALHHLRDATAAGGRPLLILHGLGEAAPRSRSPVEQTAGPAR